MGGKPEPGESPLDTAVRETREEAGVIAVDPYHAANIRFRSEFVPALSDLYAYVFVTDTFKGKLTETNEMAPRWFRLDEIPYDKMWDDDRYWLPKVLAGKFVCAEFHFDKKDKVNKMSIKEFRRFTVNNSWRPPKNKSKNQHGY